MEPFGLLASPHVERIEYIGNVSSAGSNWRTWTKPANKSMLSIVVIGSGGGGGAGAIGNINPVLGAGGGGSSGGMTIVEIPFAFLPNRLYISVGGQKTGAGVQSYVSTQPNATANHIVAYANGGSAGGNASGATAGSGGGAPGIATAANMPLGWPFRKFVVSGQAGTAGGAGMSAGVALALPTNGLRVTGGTGGGGIGTDGSAGSPGGAFTLPAAPTVYPVHPGGIAQPDDFSFPGAGNSGYRVDTGIGGYMFYGGTGGGSNSLAGAADPAYFLQAAGGNGGIGSGGGGSSAALTGSPAAALSYGGPGLVILTCY